MRDAPELDPSETTGQPWFAGQSQPDIRILPTAVSARIAAGEVVERPASVVKELIENAIDAGAAIVRVDVHGGGLDLIRVADDGHGIPADQLWLACQRHATSKLPDHDLDGIRTLGFRGEALPSIAAVAELGIVSATNDSGRGHRVTLRDGAIALDEPAPRPRGTTVTVRHLFGNVPARRAAAARVQTEITQIAQTVRLLALTAPTLRVALFTENRLVFQTTGSGDLSTALVELFGQELAGRFLSLGPVTIGDARIKGLVSGPEVTRPGRGAINLVVNGRWVQPRGLTQLIETAYRPVLPRGRHPVLALSIDVPPDQVDVNVHPAKLEVRLHAERLIGTEAGRIVKEALGRRPISLGFRPATGLAALEIPKPSLAEDEPPYDEDGLIITPGLPPLQLIGQVRDRLILLEGDAGLYLVDQHRAHERILFERLSNLHGEAPSEPVPLPEPLLIELRPAQVNRFGRRLDDLAALGFDLEFFGGRAFLLRAAPLLPGVTSDHAPALAGLGLPDELAPTLLAIADDDLDEAAAGETWRDRLLVQLSCRTAVRRGRHLDRPAMRALVEGLGNTPSPAVCPHGSPLLMHLPTLLLERDFDWH